MVFIKRDYTIYVAKTKALISFAVTAKLICVFVFAYAKCWFSHDAAQMILIQISDLTDEGLESLRVDILETDMPEKRGYGYYRGRR